VLLVKQVDGLIVILAVKIKKQEEKNVNLVDAKKVKSELSIHLAAQHHLNVVTQVKVNHGVKQNEKYRQIHITRCS
jgi:hypothetical protein